MTNAAGVIAGEVVVRHELALGTAPVFIEHYPPETKPNRQPESFDLVTFAKPVHRKRISMSRSTSTRVIALFGKPEWKPLDCVAVEALVGGRI